MKGLVVLVSTVALIVFSLALFVKSVTFEQYCGGNLKRAADANTVEMAKQELYTALEYIESKNLTRGYTSALWQTPDEDLGFWYNNIKTSYVELDSISKDASSLEKSNMLLKLRETLIDHDKNGDGVTVPNGVSRYPNNLIIGFIFWLLAAFTIGAWLVFSVDL